MYFEKKTQIIHKYIKVKDSLTSLASSGSSDRIGPLYYC